MHIITVTPRKIAEIPKKRVFQTYRVLSLLFSVCLSFKLFVYIVILKTILSFNVDNSYIIRTPAMVSKKFVGCISTMGITICHSITQL